MNSRESVNRVGQGERVPFEKEDSIFYNNLILKEKINISVIPSGCLRQKRIH